MPRIFIRYCKLTLRYFMLATVAFGLWTTASAQTKSTTTTTLAVTSNATPVTTVASGSVITLTATVKASGTALTRGQVNFCDASAKYCTDIHLLGTAQLTSAGTATLKFRPGIGSHSYKAIFVGTNIQAASSSADSALTVTGTPVTYATATAIGESGSWGKYTLTATVTESGGKPAPTGTAKFLDTNHGNAVVATADFDLATPGLSWLNPQTPSAGYEVYSPVVGDFNNDGIPDIAVANHYDGTVSILAGNGDGTFTTLPGTLAVTGAWFVTTADFNGDGKLDLAVTSNSQATTLAIFLGNGDGTFTRTTESPTVVVYAEDVTVSDFNGDGIPDMAVSTESEGVISILLGNGDGTFNASQITLSTLGCFPGVGSGDFNGDGKTDLVLTSDCEYNDGHPVVILLGNGDGTFASESYPQTEIEADAIVVADFNEDGRPDFAIAVGDGDATLTVFLNNGDGTFTSGSYGPSIPQHPAALIEGDFNDDGIVDLAVPNVYNNTVAIYQGNGDGTFTPLPATPSTGEDPASVAVGDFNGDGSVDLVAANTNGRSLTILLSQPEQTATATATDVILAAEGWHLVDANYSGDANYRPSVSGTTELWGEPPATATTLSITSGGASVTTVNAGSKITLTAAVKAGTVSLTTGQVNFCDASGPYCTDIHLLGTAQLKSNGTAAFTFVPGSGQHSYKALFLQNGGGTTSASSTVALTVKPKTGVTYPTVTTIAQSGAVGNYTLTATVTEAGGATPLTGTVSFLDTSYANAVLGTANLGKATPGLAWVNPQTPSTGTGPSTPVTADFNLDGNMDIAVVNNTSSTLTILLGNGDGTFTATANSPAISQPSFATVTGDFNGDGKPDLAILGSGPTPMVTILLGNGDGSFTQVANPTLVQYPESMIAGDFDGDGIADLAILYNVLTDGEGSIEILLGKGDGTFTPIVSTGVPSSIETLFATADLNGDGILDLVGFAEAASGNVLATYLGNGDGTFRNGGTTPITITELDDAALTDVNQDGKLDILIADAGQETITTFLGNGDGTFSQTGIVNDFPQITAGYIKVADFNEDGLPDIAVSTGHNIIPVMLGNGDGTFTLPNTMPQTTDIYTVADSLVVGDFNGDGRPDVAGIESANNAITIQLTQPTGTATATANGISPTGPAPHLVDARYSGNGNYTISTSDTTSLNVQTLMPVMSPASGVYTSIQLVKISDPVPGATIYYTTDGNLPTTASTVYNGQITVSAQYETIRAIAVATGYETSAIATANYTLNLQSPATPVFSLASGIYPNAQTVTISESTPGVAVYYTTNGSEPTVNSTPYSGPIPVSSSETLVAVAVYGYAMSPAASAQYLISSSASSFIYTAAGSGTQGYSGDAGQATAAELNYPVAIVKDKAGNLYITDADNNVVRKVAAGTGVITTFAGIGTAGYSGDGGAATSAQLSNPFGLAIDSTGNLYIADIYNYVVRKVAASTGIISTYAGNGTPSYSGDNGPATSAGIYGVGLAVDSSGNLYIADTYNNRVRKVASSTGTITTVAGNGTNGYLGDGGPATSAELRNPSGVAFDSAGNLYIADQFNNVIRKVKASDGTIATVAGVQSLSGGVYSGDGGPATSARLNGPEAVAVDDAGNLYIADTYNQAVRTVSASTGIITTVAGNGTSCGSFGGDGGPATSAALCSPLGVLVDSLGTLYVADTSHARIREVTAAVTPPSVLTATPTFSISAGTYASPQTVTLADATPGAAIYITLDGTAPTTVAPGYNGPIDASGSITIRAIVAAPGHLPSTPVSAKYTITSPPSTIISTVAGIGSYGAFSAGFTGGPATSAEFGDLLGMATDSAGNFYFSDSANAVVWRVSAQTGVISIIAGNGQNGYSGDGGPATSAMLNFPEGITLDHAGNLYIADSNNSRIRKVVLDTGVITTIAGNGYVGFIGQNGDGGLATSAELAYPTAVAFDSAENLYIADTESGLIRMVSAGTGIISTIAGNGTYSPSGNGDGGPAISAYLDEPSALAIDGVGNLYIATLYVGRIRKVAAGTGVITTIAGNGDLFGSSGDGGPAIKAEIDPNGLAVDSAGNLYLSDESGSVREVSVGTGIIAKVAGNGYSGFSGDGGSATVAELKYPTGIAFDTAGNLYIADAGNFRVRKVTSTSAATLAAIPIFTPVAGTYTSAQSVTITDATAGAAIYYTTNGTTPTTASTKYTAAIAVSATETIKAIAVAAGYTNSAVASATYTITLPIAATPVFTPAAGTYPSARSVTVADATSGATIYYTTNGTTPTTASTKYTGAIAVSSTETIEAIAVAAGYTNSAVATATYTIESFAPGALQFIPVTPCRIVDTRNATGAFGGPELAATSTRTFNIPQSSCGIPSTAVAYSLNATVVPDGELGYLTVYPAGVAQPNVSTLNSDGRVKANATITPAGASGGVSVYASNATNFILDIDGYFVPAGSSTSGLEFFPVTPCRIADTRNATGPLGGPSMAATTTRAFPVLSSTCGIPSTAQAYSLNITAVPHGGLGYLSAWPAGQSQPLVSTLNASTGAVTANAAIVPAGTSGEVSIYVSNDADAILDINGYFAPPATGGLSLYTVTPCRVIDTRNGAGAFNGTLTVPVEASSCAPPSTAKAYVLNATVVPTVPAVGLGYLSLWPAGAAQPLVSTLNASDAAITSNMAIVPTNNGSVDAYASNPTQLILDISSYFAP